MNEIVNESRPCFFVSPHFDDAILSAGGLMVELTKKVSVTCVNVFTKSGGVNTLSAQKFLKSCEASNANELFKNRNKEDSDIFDSLKIQKVNLDEVDALWRVRSNYGLRFNLAKYVPEINATYPTYRLHIKNGKIAKNDNEVVVRIFQKLKVIIPKDAIVFCPLGVGGHVDHLIVKKACEMLGVKLYYWTDFPYSQRVGRDSITKLTKNLLSYSSSKNLDEKILLSKMYKTQFNALFPSGKMPLIAEEFHQKQQEKIRIYEVKNIDFNFLEKWNGLWKNATNANIFNSPIWYQACLETFGYKNPKIYVLEDEGQTKAIWPLIETKKYFLKTICSPGEEYLDRNTILLSDENKDYLNKLITHISNDNNLYTQELTYSQTIQIRNLNCVKRQSSVSPYLPLKPNPFALTPDWQIAKIEKVIDKNQQDIEISFEKGLAQKHEREIFEIDNKSIKTQKGWKVFTKTFGIKLFANIAKKSPENVFVGVVYYQKKPIAYQTGFLSNKTFIACQTSYDSGFRFLSPGKILIYLTLKEFAKEELDLFDFSRGESGAKYDFTKFASTQYDVFIAHTRLSYLVWKCASWAISYAKDSKYIYSLYTNLRHAITKV